MKEEDVDQANEQQDKPQEVESLKVKTNIKAGGDPELPGGGRAEDPDPPD